MKKAYTVALFSVMGGLLIHLMVLFVIEIDVPEGPEPATQDFSVKFIGDLSTKAVASVIEQAALNDSSPLFMPTKWNSVSMMSDVASLQSATEIFEPFNPRLTLLDAKPTAPMEGRSSVEDETTRLPGGSAFILSRYGRKQPVPPTAASEGVSFSVNPVAGFIDSPVLKDTLSNDLTSGAPSSLWNPVRLFLHIHDGIPVGLPLISRSSGFADWDTSLQSFFTKLSFYRQLNDGYYQIWVYP